MKASITKTVEYEVNMKNTVLHSWYDKFRMDSNLTRDRTRKDMPDSFIETNEIRA